MLNGLLRKARPAPLHATIMKIMGIKSLSYTMGVSSQKVDDKRSKKEVSSCECHMPATWRSDAMMSVQQQTQPATQSMLRKLYSSLPIVGKSGKVFESRPALSTTRNLNEIVEILCRSRPENTLEVGMAFGGSSLIFADIGGTVCRGRYRHTAIDPYQSTVWDGVGMQCLEAAGLRKFIELFEEPSCLVLPRLLSEGRRFGVIYVDGSHLFEDVFVDAYFCARLLTVDGYLLFDDSSSRHVAKVLAFIDNNQLELERLPEKLFRHRIARFVGKRQLTVYQRRGPIERNWDSPFHSF
jgi:cephalosporin hydroxylase